MTDNQFHWLEFERDLPSARMKIEKGSQLDVYPVSWFNSHTSRLGHTEKHNK